MGRVMDGCRAGLAALPVAIMALLVVYFIFHALFDEKGLFALMALNSEREHTADRLSAAIAERHGLEQRVQAMRSDSLDLDLLEEQARRILGVIRQDEVVVLLNPSTSTP